jgi:ParB/RepB/Spo0J family partition protein
MRHDAHYVDQLTSRAPDTVVRNLSIAEIDRAGTSDAPPAELVTSVQQIGVLQPLLVRRRNSRYEVIAGHGRLSAAVAAGLTEVPCLVHQVDDATARSLRDADNLRATRHANGNGAGQQTVFSSALAQELTRNLATVTASLGLFANRGQSLRERLALELARAELQRTIWLLQAAEILAGESLVARRDFRAGALVEQVVAALGPERRLSDVQIAVEIADAGLMVNADESMVAVALAGLVEALLAILQRAEGARLHLRAIGRATPPALVVEVWQDAVMLPAQLAGRFFDPAFTERPGGLTAGVSLAAAQKVAELHGGRLELVAGDRAGCRLHFVVPTGA